MKLKFAVTHTMRKGITPGAANGPGTPDSPASSRAAGRQLRSSVLLAIVAFCAIVVTTPARLVGQATEFGVLNGTVTDPGGRVIAKAHVKATDVQTGEVFSADATSSGQYRIFNLLPQQYTLTFTASGFKTVDVAPFKLDVGETLTQNAMLPVGPVSETVQVAASGELLETTTVGSITTFQEQTINDLPLNGRSYTSLIQYTPGADGTRINGQFSDGNRYVLDGSSNTTMLGASSAYVPNLDLIQEFSVDSHSSKAEEGGFLGATVTAATKSGTNRVRGDIFEFNRNNEFNASNPVNAKTVLPPFHQNQYGGVVGGPVYIPRIYNGHDKTFFFAGFQGLTLHQQSFSYSRVPTADELMGNFANSLFFIGSPNQVHLFDPATTTQNGNVTNRTAFAGDVIPAGRINSLVQGYLNTFCQRRTLLRIPSILRPTVWMNIQTRPSTGTTPFASIITSARATMSGYDIRSIRPLRPARIQRRSPRSTARRVRTSLRTGCILSTPSSLWRVITLTGSFLPQSTTPFLAEPYRRSRVSASALSRSRPTGFPTSMELG
jgi:hypothetical protein